MAHGPDLHIRNSGACHLISLEAVVDSVDEGDCRRTVLSVGA